MSKYPLHAYLKESGLDMAGHVAVDLGSRHCDVEVSCLSCLLGVVGGDWRWETAQGERRDDQDAFEEKRKQVGWRR